MNIICEKERSELPDSVFGIPQERKYPMPDKKHTLSAIKFFNYVDKKYEKQLAKAIIKNMKKYSIDSSHIGKNNKFRKYLPDNMISEASLSEYGTTAGTMVGSNQTADAVYIVNYIQNNVFSGTKEPRLGICKTGMKDLHTFGGKYNRNHYINDLEEFSKEASDIKVYKYKGQSKSSFYEIIEDAETDDDYYKLLTGRELPDKQFIEFDPDFIEEMSIIDELKCISECVNAQLTASMENLYPVPILTETVQGRSYNYYRDLNGVFIQNEITKLRSDSYRDIDSIPSPITTIVKKGILI